MDKKEQALEKIANWANRGTLQQAHTEMSARLHCEGKHEVDLQDDTITFYSVHKEGGFLGIGGKQVREPVLQLVREEDHILIEDQPMDDDVVMELAKLLAHH